MISKVKFLLLLLLAQGSFSFAMDDYIEKLRRQQIEEGRARMAADAAARQVFGNYSLGSFTTDNPDAAINAANLRKQRAEVYVTTYNSIATHNPINTWAPLKPIAPLQTGNPQFDAWQRLQNPRYPGPSMPSYVSSYLAQPTNHISGTPNTQTFGEMFSASRSRNESSHNNLTVSQKMILDHCGHNRAMKDAYLAMWDKDRRNDRPMQYNGPLIPKPIKDWASKTWDSFLKNINVRGPKPKLTPSATTASPAIAASTATAAPTVTVTAPTASHSINYDALKGIPRNASAAFASAAAPKAADIFARHPQHATMNSRNRFAGISASLSYPGSLALSSNLSPSNVDKAIPGASQAHQSKAASPAQAKSTVPTAKAAEKPQSGSAQNAHDNSGQQASNSSSQNSSANESTKSVPVQTTAPASTADQAVNAGTASSKNADTKIKGHIIDSATNTVILYDTDLKTPIRGARPSTAADQSEFVYDTATNSIMKKGSTVSKTAIDVQVGVLKKEDVQVDEKFQAENPGLAQDLNLPGEWVLSATGKKVWNPKKIEIEEIRNNSELRAAVWRKYPAWASQLELAPPTETPKGFNCLPEKKPEVSQSASAKTNIDNVHAPQQTPAVKKQPGSLAEQQERAFPKATPIYPDINPATQNTSVEALRGPDYSRRQPGMFTLSEWNQNRHRNRAENAPQLLFNGNLCSDSQGGWMKVEILDPYLSGGHVYKMPHGSKFEFAVMDPSGTWLIPVYPFRLVPTSPANNTYATQEFIAQQEAETQQIIKQHQEKTAELERLAKLKQEAEAQTKSASVPPEPQPKAIIPSIEPAVIIPTPAPRMQPAAHATMPAKDPEKPLFERLSNDDKKRREKKTSKDREEKHMQEKNTGTQSSSASNLLSAAAKNAQKNNNTDESTQASSAPSAAATNNNANSPTSNTQPKAEDKSKKNDSIPPRSLEASSNSNNSKKETEPRSDRSVQDNANEQSPQSQKSPPNSWANRLYGYAQSAASSYVNSLPSVQEVFYDAMQKAAWEFGPRLVAKHPLAASAAAATFVIGNALYRSCGSPRWSSSKRTSTQDHTAANYGSYSSDTAHQSASAQPEAKKEKDKNLQLLVISPESEEFRTNLQHARDVYYKLMRESYFTNSDQRLLTTLNEAVALGGAQSRFSELTPEAKALLGMCNISPEIFDKMTGDKLQQHLYDTTATILHDQANLLAQHHDNKQIQEYIQATTDMSVVALDMIRTGNPQEAIATVNMAQSFHEATEIAIGVLKGAGSGAAASIALNCALRFMPPHVQVAFAVLSKVNVVYQALNIHKNYAEFVALSPKERAEQISSFFSAYYTGKLLNHPRFVKAWKDAAKICKAELAGLAGLVTVEAELAVPVVQAGANPSTAATATHPELAMFGNHPAPPLPQTFLNGSSALPNPLLSSTAAQTAAGVQARSSGATAASSSAASAMDVQQTKDIIASLVKDRPDSIWAKIKPTQARWNEYTLIPKSFEIEVGEKKLWVNANGSKHLMELTSPAEDFRYLPDPSRIRFDLPARETLIIHELALNELHEALTIATKDGIPLNQKLTINGWQIEIRPAIIPDGHPTLMHARSVSTK